MKKYNTGDIFLTNSGDILQITSINKELVALSVYNKAITVQWLYRTGGIGMTAVVNVVNNEINIPYAALEDWNCKYLGQNLKSVWILYGNNLKKLGDTK